MKKHFELEKPPASLPYPLVGVIVLVLATLALGTRLDWHPGLSILLGLALASLPYCIILGFTSLKRVFTSARRERSL